MRKNKVCPKCGGTSITFANEISSGGGMGGHEYIGLKPRLLGGMKKRFVAYICDKCGFSELYLV